jgi:fermentation-respiration switch protein FrsA (DUF1100 family)
MNLEYRQTIPARKRVLMFLIYIFIGYLLLLALIRIFESHLIFFPNYPSRLEGDWHPSGLPVEDVWLTASDGTKLHAWWIPNPQAKFTFLAFHGNASNMANRAPTYEFLASTPANVLALEYRGYGHSEGNPSEAGINRDAEAAYQFLVATKSIKPKTIIAFGQSLGTTVASYLASQREVGGVVLEAPFPSASRLAGHFYPFLPGVGLVVYSQFNNEKRLQHIDVPILIVHCTQDPVIPFRFGQEVYRAAKSPKTFLPIDGVCHEEASAIEPARYRASLQQFLGSLLATEAPKSP